MKSFIGHDYLVVVVISKMETTTTLWFNDWGKMLAMNMQIITTLMFEKGSNA